MKKFEVAAGMEFMRAIASILPPGCSRVVIDAEVNGPVRVYCANFLERNDIQVLVEAALKLEIKEPSNAASGD